MSPGLAAFLMQMPSARQLLETMLDDLRAGRSVLGLLPEGIDPGVLRSALWDGLEYWHMRIHEVSIPHDTQSPAAALGHVLGIDWGATTTPRTVENLLRQVVLPEILFLHGFEELAARDRVQWLRFVVQWAQVCQGMQSADVPSSALCLVAKASTVPYSYIDSTNVFLAIRPWWGIPTILEMQLLCRLTSAQEKSPSIRCKEHIIPSLSGSDLNLGDFLWDKDKWKSTSTKLTDVLRDFAHERGWTQDEGKDWAKYHLRQSSGPLSSSHLYQAWAHGMVHWTPEHGLECHSAILALLNRREALDHRLWRGQTGFLLPEIDKVRLALCAHLNQSYGKDWPHKWQQPENDQECQEVRNSPFACQWGHLKFLLWNRQELNRERRWLPLVNKSWYIRTELAHYRPISLTDYEAFCREVKRGYQAGLMTI